MNYNRGKAVPVQSINAVDPIPTTIIPYGGSRVYVATSGVASTTFYTVPASKKFYLTYLQWTITASAALTVGVYGYNSSPAIIDCLMTAYVPIPVPYYDLTNFLDPPQFVATDFLHFLIVAGTGLWTICMRGYLINV